MRKTSGQNNGNKLTTLLISSGRDSDTSPELAEAFLASLPSLLRYSPIIDSLLFAKPRPVFALEVGVVNQRIAFMITCSTALEPYVRTQISARYPLASITPVADPLSNELERLHIGELRLTEASFYPLQTWREFKNADPTSAYLSIMAKAASQEIIWLQCVLSASPAGWQIAGQKALDRGRMVQGERGKQTRKELPEAAAIREKITKQGFATTIRIGASSPSRLNQIAGAFTTLSRADGNRLTLVKPMLDSWRLRLLKRQTTHKRVLSLAELASIWHLPSKQTLIPSIVWGKSILSEAPESLPVLKNDLPHDKSVNLIGTTTYKNSQVEFGIKDADRLRHVWAIGKTGVGKSTLIANMVIDDLKKGKGVAIIDPHGDLSEIILEYIPSYRINDVIYFNPVDRERPVQLNVLEIKRADERELIVSGIVAIFYKLYGDSWGPRLEYILRNTLLALSEMPQATLVMVPRVLTDPEFRKRVLHHVHDSVIVNFFANEYEAMPERLRQDAIAPILNKIGRFVSSPLIRNIISSPRSSVNLESIMSEKKILIANLSQGLIGEDNAALLGAMLITQCQLAAMKKVSVPEKDRADFFLYVDEFQNFATTSFIKILAEARKYRLALLMANQYIGQIPSDVQKAILGNVGSILSFTLGADDAHHLEKEFAGVFTQEDLLGLDRYQIALRLTVNGRASRAFLAHTLPVPNQSPRSRDKVIRVSRERWGKQPQGHMEQAR